MQLFYERAGDGSPVLLLHPVGLDHTFWGDLPTVLSARNMVLAVDTRGHGKSPDASRPGRMGDRVADVIQVIESLGSVPSILVGVSFGGMIAQNVAGTRPDLVCKLVVAGCPLAMPPAAHDAISQRGRAAEEGGMESVVESTLERWFTNEFLSSAQPPVERVRQRLMSNTPSGWAAAWEAICEHDARDSLPNFRGETLVVAGERDAATSVEAMKEISRAAQNAKLVVLPGAPHMMQLETAAAFRDLICDFVDGAVPQ